MPMYSAHGDGLIRMPEDRRFSLHAPGTAILVVAAVAIWGARPGGNLNVQPADLTFSAQPVGAPAAVRTVVLRNRGLRPVVLSQFEVVGEQARDFVARAGECAQSLAAHEDCEVSIAFAPSASGQRRAALLVRAVGVPQATVVPLTGMAWQAAVSIDPPALRFLARAGNAEPAPQFVRVTNAGGGPVQVTSVNLTGPGAFSLEASDCRARTLAQGGDCRVRVAFRPPGPGALHGVLVVETSAGVVQASLTAETAAVPVPNPVPVPAPAPARLSVEPPFLAFGPLRLDDHRRAVIRVSNPGASPLQVTSVRFPDGGGLKVDATRCTRDPLPPGGECSFGIEFAPSRPGPWSADLVVDSNAGRRTVQLSAEGLAPAVAEFAVIPMAVHFGTVPLAAGAARQTVELSSTGTAPLEIRSIVAAPGEFATSAAACESPLPPGRRCTLAIDFRPRQPDYASGTLTIETNAGGRIVPLDGIGVRPPREVPARLPAADIRPPLVDFGTVPTRNRRRADVAVGSVGAEALQVRSVVANPAGIFPVQADECTRAPIAPRKSCRIQVTFQPPGADAFTGSLAIDTNAGLYTVPLRGQGTPARESGAGKMLQEWVGKGVQILQNQPAPPPPQKAPKAKGPAPAPAPVGVLAVDPVSIDFRLFRTESREVVVRNTGAGPLSITAADLSPQDVFTIARSSCKDALPPQGECRLLVTFKPAGPAGPHRAVLNIVSNGGTQAVSLSGTVLKIE